jgi:hypothetical protein
MSGTNRANNISITIIILYFDIIVTVPLSNKMRMNSITDFSCCNPDSTAKYSTSKVRNLLVIIYLP